MKVTGVDNHPNRGSTEVHLEERNKFMANAITAINKHGVLITGVNHLQGLLTPTGEGINRKKFHIVPFNLVSLYHCVSNYEEFAFASDPQNAIQVTRAGFSDPTLP